MQTYKCGVCGYKFQNKRRKQKLRKKVLRRYVWQRQTYADLAWIYGRSEKWVQKTLDESDVRSVVRVDTKDTVIVADATFFSRQSGVVVFRDPQKKKNLWWKEIVHEKAEVYRAGIQHLRKNGFTIAAAVLDGRRGVRAAFRGIPVQMCHFHQKQIINRYLTTRPKIEASKDLRNMVLHLPQKDEKTFAAELKDWYETWKPFLQEKTTNMETGRWCYTHKRLRSAYRSLKNNMPFLFTYQRYPHLGIPNTTNSLDGFFNRMKSLLNVHRGLSPKRRKRIMTEILKGMDV